MSLPAAPGRAASGAGARDSPAPSPPSEDAAPQPPAGTLPSADPAGSLLERLRQIQNVCFAAYPEDLLRRMSGKEGAAPEAIRVDPEGQMRYLGTEEVTGKGLFYPSRLEEILPALRATLRPERTFLDLGSGDGRVVFLAAVLGARATGIEYDRALHRVAREARRRLAGVVDPARAALRRGDFFALDLDRYDVLFYFGSGSYSEPRLFEKIAREMRPGSVLLLAHGREDSLPPLPLLATYGVVRIYAPPPR